MLVSRFPGKQRDDPGPERLQHNTTLSVKRWLPPKFLADAYALSLPKCVSSVFQELCAAREIPSWSVKLPHEDALPPSVKEMVGSVLRWNASLIAEQVKGHIDLVQKKAVASLPAKP